MQFVSIEWVTWIAASVAVFWLAPATWRHYVLAAVTLAFLLIHAWQSAVILSGFTVATYFLTNKPDVSGLRVGLVIFVLATVLLVYKALDSAASPEDFIQEVLIPLGLSYYTLRCVHYLLERYKGKLPPHGFKEYAFYLFFIPTVVVGPIHRFNAFISDLRRHRWDGRLMSEGLERILYGYVKITVLANYLISTEFARYIGSLDAENQALVFYLEIVRGGLNLYLQFSGFSDIAIGFSRLLGFKVMENFNWPYLQANISDFWRCWHISLTSWCREYVYTTVFSISRSPALGVVATMLVIGLWHELSIRYLVWALYHGIGIVIWQKFQPVKKRLPAIENRYALNGLKVLSVILTVHFVWFGFVIVRQPDLATVWKIFSTVLFFWL